MRKIRTSYFAKLTQWFNAGLITRKELQRLKADRERQALYGKKTA